MHLLIFMRERDKLSALPCEFVRLGFVRNASSYVMEMLLLRLQAVLV